MGWEGIGTLIGTISSWLTPEKAKARKRRELEELKRQEKELVKHGIKDSKDSARLLAIRKRISRLQNYFISE